VRGKRKAGEEKTKSIKNLQRKEDELEEKRELGVLLVGGAGLA